jgi:hypothetical protein
VSRARDLPRKLLAATNDGAELLAYALAVWRDEKRPHGERWAAFELLMDLAFGMAPQGDEVESQGELSAQDAAAEEMLSRLRARAQKNGERRRGRAVLTEKKR